MSEQPTSITPRERGVIVDLTRQVAEKAMEVAEARDALNQMNEHFQGAMNRVGELEKELEEARAETAKWQSLYEETQMPVPDSPAGLTLEG